jgi:polysaccharide export outer membrane protein
MGNTDKGRRMDTMKFRFALTFAITCILLCVGVLSQENLQPLSPDTTVQSPDAGTQTPELQQRNPRYRLEVADILSLTFPFSPEFNQTVMVQPDGFVSLIEIGDVHVQGQTVPDATQTIERAYSKTLRDPVITATLKDFSKPYFIVNGMVRNPGKFDLRGDTTVAEGIAIAGGFTESSKHSEVWIYHRLPDNRLVSKKLNLKQMLARGDLNEAIRLQPGDMVFVPQNTLSKLKGLVVPRATVGPTVRESIN